jgi:hypothetical protein
LLQVEDVPSVWNQKMKDYLGTAPDDDAKGCLQVRNVCMFDALCATHMCLAA